jgi:hypothetical protein
MGVVGAMDSRQMQQAGRRANNGGQGGGSPSSYERHATNQEASASMGEERQGAGERAGMGEEGLSTDDDGSLDPSMLLDGS